MNLPETIKQPGAENYSSAQVFGEALRDQLNKYDDFYFFSPDETTSNRLSAVFEASDRAWGLKTEEWDKNLSHDGHIVEMLSENTLFSRERRTRLRFASVAFDRCDKSCFLTAYECTCSKTYVKVKLGVGKPYLK